MNLLKPFSELPDEVLLLRVLLGRTADRDVVVPAPLPVDLGHVLREEAAEDAVVDVELVEARDVVHRAHGRLADVLDVRPELGLVEAEALEVLAQVVQVPEERLERARARLQPLVVHVVLALHRLLERVPELGVRPGRVVASEDRADLRRRGQGVALGELLADGELAGHDALREELPGGAGPLPGPRAVGRGSPADVASKQGVWHVEFLNSRKIKWRTSTTP